MQRQHSELVPIGDALSGMGGPVKAIREASPQARRRGSAARQRFQGLCRILRWPPGTEVVSITEIRRLAEQGDADAQFNLGVL